ncbi:hypothetical protein HY489_05700 [Candidatus Woesearchaeota archaeon]|nr:hypothetical protein [Candidatus Woesearchaeota archaeon]
MTSGKTIWDYVPGEMAKRFEAVAKKVSYKKSTDLDDKPVFLASVDLEKIDMDDFAYYWAFTLGKDFENPPHMNFWRHQLTPEELRAWDKAWEKAVLQRKQEIERIQHLLMEFNKKATAKQ